MADGKMVIAVDADAKQAQKELASVQKRIETIEARIQKANTMRSPLVEQAAQLSVELDKANAKLLEMQNSGASTTSIAAQKETVAALQAQYNQVQSRVEAYDRQLQSANYDLEQAKQKAGELTERVTDVEKAARGMAKATEKINKSMSTFGKRLGAVIHSALVFTVITQALAKLRTWLGETIVKNEEARAAVARLKAALLTLAQPILNVVIPAFVTLMNVLTRSVALISNVVSKLFGTTLKNSAEQAKNLYEEQNAIKGVGGAAEKASKQLASFDEINQLSSNDSSSGGGGASVDSSISPDFKSQIQDSLMGIAELFVGTALLALGAILTFSGTNIPLGLALMAIGAAAIYDAVTENWGSVSEMLQGPIGKITAIVSGALLVLGAVLAFSGASIPLGIGLMMAGAVGLAATVAANWGTISEALEGPIGEVTAIISSALLVLGAVLTFSGANIGLGIGLMAAGAAGLATVAAVNWDSIVDALKGPIGGIVALVGSALLALGVVLLFTGVGTPLAIGLILAGAAGLAAAVAPNWDFILEKIRGCWEKIKTFWKTKIAPIFTAAWWKKLAVNALNGFISGFESFVNTIIRGINWLISKLNAISVDIPEWVPLVGGKTFGFNISNVGEISLPRLATGAVIPPNREFMAVLGDQTSGNNIEAPESLIRKIVREETSGSGRLETLLQTLIDITREGKTLELDGVAFAKVTKRSLNNNARAYGVPIKG